MGRIIMFNQQAASGAALARRYEDARPAWCQRHRRANAAPLAWIVALLLAQPLAAADWTQFRGPTGTGVGEGNDLPITWSKSENVRWKADLPGRGLSSPVIAGGRVYVTANSGYQQKRLHVLCFDAADGKQLWERQFWATGGTNCHPKTSMAAPTPCTDGDRVYALFATCDLVCLDKDGNLVWYRSLVGDYPTVTNQVGMAASPALWKDTLFVAMENAGESFAAAIDTKTGKNRWKIYRSRAINWVTPLVVNDGKRVEVLFQSGGELTAYDPQTGVKRWSYEGKGLSTIPSPTAGNGLIFVPGGELVALKPGTEKAAAEVQWSVGKLSPKTASPLVYQDRVYAINGAGVLNCAEAATGKLLWQERLKGPFSASPIAADGKLYLVNEAGVTFVVKSEQDKGTILASNALEETILGTPAIAGGAIFLRSDQHLYCIGASKK
jgi:outer membrane protein assembly factor BamB